LSAPHRKVIHTEHTRSWLFRQNRLSNTPYQRVRTCAHAKPKGSACTSLAADGEADQLPDAEWTPQPSKPKTSDPYTALWLLPGAPPEVVKAAYKALATLHHPDKPGGDDERMRAINSAYQQLAA